MYYQINKGSKNFGTTDVFYNIQFEIKGNEKIALIGKNGTGKTTILKVISGIIDLDSGTIFKQQKIQIGYLAQTSFENENNIVEDELRLVFSDMIKMEKELETMGERLKSEPNNQKLLNQYTDKLESFQQKGGYQYETEMNTVFTKFGFSKDDLKRAIATFSGGQRTKLAFVKLLLSKPDILLLDEPTNHLDLSTIEWLEEYLSHYPKAIVIVSHDRLFLDRIVGVVYELELGPLTKYVGNYTSYIHQKEVNIASLEDKYYQQQKEIERLEKLIEKFRYKKNKAAFAQSKIKYLERMEKVEKPKSDNQSFKVTFAPKFRGGQQVLTLDNLEVGYDKALFKVSLNIQRQQRIAIIGDNGTGKSALVKTITNKLTPLSGQMMLGHQIEIGYFDQQLAQWESSKTVLEELWDLYPELDRTTIRTTLGRFLFAGDDVFKNVNVLSGGEKVRLNLAKLMLQRANFLILDEPTNHLDMLGKESLEAALLDYLGTILFVSHDRYFINKLATDLLIIKDRQATFFQGNYQDYLDKNTNRKEEVINVVKTKEIKPKPKNLKKQVEQLEKKITLAEQEIKTLESYSELEEYYSDFMKMQELEVQIEDAEDQLKVLMREWDQLVASDDETAS